MRGACLPPGAHDRAHTFMNDYHRLLAIAAALVLSACEMGNANDDSDEDETPAVPVETQATTRGDVFAVYSGTAALEVDAEAEVVAKVAGEIRQILVEEGDFVEAGQILVKLDGDRLRLEAQEARANLQRLEQDYNRNVDLHEKGLVSAGAFESLKFEMDALRAAYDRARLELSYTEIRSPIQGVVAERHIKIGNTVEVNAPVFTVTDFDPLISYLHVPERHFRRLAPGQVAVLEVDALPDARFQGTVTRISPVVDPATGTFKVTTEVSDDTTRLKPGMFARINIVYASHEQALLIPRVAVVSEDSTPAVFVVEDGVARRRPVRTGLAAGADIEILEGLTDADNVVVVGQSGLKDGTEVEAVGDSPPDRLAGDTTTSP